MKPKFVLITCLFIAHASPMVFAVPLFEIPPPPCYYAGTCDDDYYYYDESDYNYISPSGDNSSSNTNATGNTDNGDDGPDTEDAISFIGKLLTGRGYGGENFRPLLGSSLFLANLVLSITAGHFDDINFKALFQEDFTHFGQ